MIGRQFSILPGVNRMLLCVSDRETNWPRLWPIQDASGAYRPPKPEWLFDFSYKRRAKKVPKKVEEVEV